MHFPIHSKACCTFATLTHIFSLGDSYRSTTTITTTTGTFNKKTDEVIPIMSKRISNPKPQEAI